MTTSSIFLMEFSIDGLKVLAIVAVFFIHLMGYAFNNQTVDTSTGQYLLYLNQFFRYCVPLFVMLSGYTLARKYLKAPFSLAEFYLRRVWKILPQYIFWSYILFITQRLNSPIIELLPNWYFFRALVFGEADYHLYFVPMIFQLYLIFPFIFWAMRKWQLIPVVILIFTQLMWYFVITSKVEVDPYSFLSDQRQYLFSLSWIGYFVMGMYLSSLQFSRPNIIYASVLCILGFCLSIYDAKRIIANGTDIIIATRFTRIPIFLYATGFSILVITLRDYIFKPFTSFAPLITFFGRQSYAFYLFHTILVRYIFGFLDGNLSLSYFFKSLVILLIALAISNHAWTYVMPARQSGK